MKRLSAIVIGTSAGGHKALHRLFSGLRDDFSIPIAVVQHMSPESENLTVSQLNGICRLQVKEAEDKEPMSAGRVYVAPPDYHLLIEKGGEIGLSVDPKVNYSRPSIDVLFETAAEAFAGELAAVVLTGANSDGTAGCAAVKACGGLVVAEDPRTAESPVMPASVIDNVGADYIMAIDSIAELLNKLCRGSVNG